MIFVKKSLTLKRLNDKLLQKNNQRVTNSLLIILINLIEIIRIIAHIASFISNVLISKM